MEHLGKVHDPGINLDSDGSDTETPNNSKLLGVLRNSGISSTLNLLHNELQSESDSDEHLPPSVPLEVASGPQAANPKSKKSTVCNGGKPSPGYASKCEQTTSGKNEFKIYTADAKTWSCRLKHEGLCWVCYNAPTCPVCGSTKRRLPQ